ncbi:MAG: hypothetical protein P3T54_05610 [Dehalogenimonas sp.]|jgi:hypothetical protein|uniref:Major facilitator superfamily (MFS) profile domain-containing protein n=1 Tax=Candidatus Dehalogenimonas loeffleri TaxID=3127115 RepID=A0ABZ2JB01_9CHLR|nr:hypothetical protein [Dehalogenimonas sp.]
MWVTSSVSVVVAVGIGGPFWSGAILSYGFLMASLMALNSPRIGGGLAIILSLLAIAASLALIFNNYDASRLIGSLMLAFASLMLIGAVILILSKN